jgi:hypothetical protein
MPVPGDKFLKNALAASKPPAEAPMATIGKDFILLFSVEREEDILLLICFQILVPSVTSFGQSTLDKPKRPYFFTIFPPLKLFYKLRYILYFLPGMHR